MHKNLLSSKSSTSSRIFIPKPIVERCEGGCSITKGEYSLYIRRIPEGDLGRVFFWSSEPHKNLPPPFDTNSMVAITGRSFQQYISERKDLLPILPSHQYVEVGAEIGGFIPEIVTKLRRKPIIIDPADYAIMRELLSYALSEEDCDVDARCVLRIFVQRIDIITDPERVTLLNMKLGEAVVRHSEILDCADVLIDLAGPIRYGETEFKLGDKGHNIQEVLETRVRQLEKQILKNK
jgi:hypothetical protein